MILATGATGFVGRPLVRELVRRGHAVRAHVRQRSPVVDALGATDVVVGDLRDTGWFPAALDGVDRVIHVAGISHRVAPDSDHHAVNRDAALHLARAAAAAGVRRFLFVSSVAVYGAQWAHVPLDEDAPFDGPRGDAYGQAKREAEAGLRSLARETGMEITIVRPPLVYGAGAKGNLERLLRVLDTPLPLPLGRARGARSMISVVNLVDFLILAVMAPEAAGNTFVVTDGEPVTVAGLVREIRHALGRPARLLPIPGFALYWPARLLGHGDELRLLFGPLCFDDARARRLLGWSAPQSRADGVREMVLGYVARARGGTDVESEA